MIKEHSDLVASWRVELWRLARLVPWSLYPRVPLGGAQGGGRLHHLHHHHHEHDDEGVQRASQRGLHLASLGSPWRLIPRQPGRRNPAPRGLKIKFEKCTRAKVSYSEWKLQQLTPRTWFSYSHWSALPFETKWSHSRIMCSLNADIYLLKYCRATAKKLRCLDSAGAFFSQSQPFHQLLSLRIGLNEDLKVQRMEIFYDPETFIKVVIFFHPCHSPYYVSY